MPLEESQMLISLIPASIVIIMFLGFLVWKKTFTKNAKIARDLKEIGYDLTFDWVLGRSIKMASDDPKHWRWEIQLDLFKEKFYISFDVWVPQDHEYLQYLSKNIPFNLVFGLTTENPDKINETIIEILEEFQNEFDRQLEWEKTKEAPLKWEEIHSWSEANGKMLKAFHALERIPKLTEKTKALGPILAALRDMRIKETRKKEKLETKDAKWVEIDEGVAKGYLITAIPLEKNDIGTKSDKWKGILKDPKSGERLIQTSASDEKAVLKSVKEIAYIQIGEEVISSFLEEEKEGYE